MLSGGFMVDVDSCYKEAEAKAKEYFSELLGNAGSDINIKGLVQGFKNWESNHKSQHNIGKYLLPSKEPQHIPFDSYYRWLKRTNRLDDYIERSVLYIFLRDLGQNVSDQNVRKKISSTKNKLKKHIEKNIKLKGVESTNSKLSDIFEKSKKDGYNEVLVWLFEKLVKVGNQIPEEMDYKHTMRKLVKLVVGVTLHQIYNIEENLSKEQQRDKINNSIRLGYYYGLTYPFIDDLLDSKSTLTEEERNYCSEIIKKTLIIGSVPELVLLNSKNSKFINFIYSELKESFEYIKNNQPEVYKEYFFEQAYVFFTSQEIDRSKKIDYPFYSNEEIYVPIILKSSHSRLIARNILGNRIDNDFDNRTFYFGILNQMHDDLTDLEQDLNDEHFTPFTYYIRNKNNRKDLINPIEIYWSVLDLLINNIYNGDEKVKDALLCRAINIHKGILKKGEKYYDDITSTFKSSSTELNLLIKELATKSIDTYFFDKILRQQLADFFSKNKEKKIYYESKINEITVKINNNLHIKEDYPNEFNKEIIINSANYSIEAGGKRIRPLLAYVIGVIGYKIKEDKIFSLLRSIEYMHTASLVFDDLPSQDNADIRRGRQTLHKKLNSHALAELTGLFLMMKATEEQASLDGFEAERVQRLIKYSSYIIQNMCIGQAQDINSNSNSLTLEQVELLSIYKTGLAIEASLVMPAILANASETDINALKKFSKYAGLAFQAKDDILDFEGSVIITGKPTKNDVVNQKTTFVTLLGISGAKSMMYEYFFKAKDSLKDLSVDTELISYILNYIVNRNN